MRGAALPSNELHTPAVLVLANGSALAGVIDARVTSNNHYGCDRFAVTVALSATDLSSWASASQVPIEIRIGIDGSWASLLQGEVDTVEIDAVQRTLRISGRDLTARLIEARTQESFQNRTASEIAQLLAARHGLQASVTPTTTPVGRYYQLEHDHITLDQFARATSEWDLLVFLARQEGFDLRVEGSTLYFQQPQTATATALTVTPADLTELRLERALTLARDIEVTVKSWNSLRKTAFTETARAARGTPGTAGTARQQYVVVRPNLTPDQALSMAQSMLAELSQHERVITCSMPGELSLTPRGQVILTGTGTEFDQAYFVAELDRTISLQRGFIQRVRAKNASPASQSTIPATDFPPAPGS
jgi:phage protein D